MSAITQRQAPVFKHWKACLPEAGTGRSLLLWVLYGDDNDDALESTGIYYDESSNDDTPNIPCFMDYQTWYNDDYAQYLDIDGQLIDSRDGGKVDIYWAYAEPVYGPNPFEIGTRV